MARALIVEGKTLAVMADLDEPAIEVRIGQSRGHARVDGLVRLIGGVDRVLRKCMQDIGQQQLLMLLFMVQTELDQRGDLGAAAARVQQRQHRGVDMATIGGDLVQRRTRQKPPLRARMARADGLVIGIEQV